MTRIAQEVDAAESSRRIQRDSRACTRPRFSPAYDTCTHLLAVMLMGCIFLSCSNDEDNWTYVGLRQVWVDTIEAPDTMSIADTLTVILDGEGGCDRPEFSHVDMVRDSSQVDLTVWAGCSEWSGPGVVPPTDTRVWCEHKVFPPFYPGPLLLVAHRLDGSTLNDTVVVEP